MSNPSKARDERVAVFVSRSQAGVGDRRRSRIGRSLAAVLALGLLTSTSLGQLVDTTDLDVSVTEGVATADSFATSISTLPTDPVNFALTWDTTRFDVVAFKGDPGNPANQVPDATAFAFDPSEFDVDPLENIVTINVTAIDNDIDDAVATLPLQITVTSTDGNYNGNDRTVNVIITDNDTAGINLDTTAVNVSEDGTTDTYEVVLTSEPTADVTVDITVDAQVTTDVDPLLFTPANWDVAQTVTVSAVNDDVAEGAHAGVITHTVTSGDADYNGFALSNVDATITDNDTVGINLNTTNVNVSEDGATDTYDVVLTSEPTADVTVDLTVDAQVTTDVDPLVFTAANWDVPQTVTVSAVNDDVAEGAHAGVITHTVTSGDGNYDGFVLSNVDAAITDNDTVGINLNTVNVNVSEAGTTADYDVVLTSEPTADVTIDIAVDAQVSTNVSQLIFTDANWDVPQTVTVSAVNDDIVEGAHAGVVSHTVTSGDADYNGFALANVNAAIADNDTAGIDLNTINVNVVEAGATADYDVVLTSEPTADVTIDIAVDAQVSTNVNQLIFTSANWDVPQTVTVSAINDDIAEGAHAGVVSHTVTSGDANYNGFVLADVNAAITDDDVAGVTIDPTAVNVGEGGPNATYDVVLTSEPTAQVQILITPDVPQVTTNPTILNFNDTNWDTPQTVTVGALNDSVVEADPHFATLSHTVVSLDGVYNGIPVDDVDVTIADDDVAGINFTGPTPASQIEDGGGSSVVQVTLNTEPTADVNVTISVPDPTQVTVLPNLLTLTPANWNDPLAHQFTVTPIADTVIEGDSIFDITATAASADLNYNGLAEGVGFTITDDDTAEILVTGFGAGLTTDEAAGPARNYTIELSNQPENRIVVTIAPNRANQLDVMPSRLIFDPLLPALDPNGVNVKNITITPINDKIAEGTQTVTLNHTVTGAPFNQGSFVNVDTATNTSQFDVEITDDDTALVTVTESGGSTQVAEGGATDTYSVVLNSEPTADVTVALNNTVPAQVTASTNALTFTPANWNVAQVVTVTAVDDALVDGDQNVAIAHTVTSADPIYNGLGANTVTVTVADNDTGGVTIVELDGVTAVAEGGTTDTYSVVLDAQPASDVAITLGFDDQLAPTPTTLTFTNGNWDVPQIVTVAAEDDNIVEGETTATITHTARSSDNAFDGLLIADVVVSITDNDAPSILVDAGDGVEVNEDGPTTDNYVISLGTLPIGSIQVAVTPDNQTSISTGGATGGPGESLLVTLSTATPAVTVSVTAVPDEQNEGQHTSTITHTVAAATQDPAFVDLVIDPVIATVLDVLNDSDFDGLTDEEEEAGFAISVYIPSGDADGGLLRRVLRFRTDPLNPDSDGDQIRDFDEVVTFARFANDDGSVPGVDLDASAARQIQTGDATRPVAGIVVLGPGQETGLTGQTAFRPKPVWGVRTLASNDFIEDDPETQETLALLAAAGLSISGADTDGDGIGDADDPAPQFNPALFGVEDLPQAELLDFDVDRDGFPELGEGFPEISETTIEATRGIDYSNDGTVTDGFDFGTIADSGAFRVVFSDQVAGLIGDGLIQSDLAVVDTCPDEFNPDNDGDGIQDENPCQDAPTAAGGCCGTPLGFSLMLPLVWTMAARRGGKRRGA